MLPVVVSDRFNELAEPFDVMSREFERVLSRMSDGLERQNKAFWAPYGLDVREDAGHFYVEAELPGFKREECNVTMENGILNIRGERKEAKESKKGEPLHIERRWTQFERSVALPTPVKEDSVKASLNAGILTVTLDKRQEVKPRKITIAAEEPKALAPG
jgi:HSP20 family protein